MEDKRNIQIIEWEHLDKKKFYVFGVAMTMMIRVSVYPFTLIRTRLQVQKGKSLYHGTFDAFVKILRADGVTGLYRGFLVNTFTLISGQCYVTTYELTRKFVADYSQSNTVKSLVAGGSASLVAQSITVPIDVVSQHLMMQRKGERMGRFQVRASPQGRGVVAFGQTKDIIKQILRADGLRGFYRGYVASLLTYIPNSAVWWPFYHFYAEQLSYLCPKECPHIVFQAVSGPLAAATASVLTNPMDVIRTRVQLPEIQRLLQASLPAAAGRDPADPRQVCRPAAGVRPGGDLGDQSGGEPGGGLGRLGQDRGRRQRPHGAGLAPQRDPRGRRAQRGCALLPAAAGRAAAPGAQAGGGEPAAGGGRAGRAAAAGAAGAAGPGPAAGLAGPAQRTEGAAGRAGGARVRRRPPDQEQRAVEGQGQGRLPLRTSEVVASP